MQISEQKFLKSYLHQDFSPGRCGHAGGLGLAVEPEKWKKIEFVMQGAWNKRNSICSSSDFASPYHFQIQFTSIFRGPQASRGHQHD